MNATRWFTLIFHDDEDPLPTGVVFQHEDGMGDHFLGKKV